MAVTKKEVVTIRPIKEETRVLRIEGTTPLITHKWSHKCKLMIPAGARAFLLAQGKTKSITDKVKDDDKYETPIEQFINSLYWIGEKPTEYTEEAFDEAVASGAKFGMKVEAFKKAAIGAAYAKKWIKDKKNNNGLFFIEPDYVDDEGNQLVIIQGDVPHIREDTVCLSGISHSADLRWRPQFDNWFVDLRITYDVDGLYSFEDIANMIMAGGRYYGIAEMRPEKGGQFGMYKVVTMA